MYYQNKKTHEVWKLDHVERGGFYQDGNRISIYVFENGERWHQDDFSKHWVELEGYIPTEEELARN